MPYDPELRWMHTEYTPYYATVGYLCHQWNVLERLYTHLASDIMRLKRSKHDLIFRHLGTVAVGNFLTEYAEAHIKTASTKAQIAHVTKFVERCRVNRNAIVHGWPSLDTKLEAVLIRSKADQRRNKASEFYVALKDIQRVCDDCEIAGRLCVALQFLFSRTGVKTFKQILGGSGDWRGRLHAKPPLPEFVMGNPQKSKVPRPPRRSSPRKSRPH